MSRTTVWLILALMSWVAGAQVPDVVLDGKPVGVAQLEQLHKGALDALASLEKTPLSDAGANAARKAILASERDALKATIDLMNAIGRAPKETAGLIADEEAARARLVDVRARGGEHPRFDTVTQQEADEAQSDSNAAEAARDAAIALAARAEERARQRTDGLAALAKKIADANEAHGALLQELEAATDDAARSEFVRRVRTAELKLRALELGRAHHQALLKRDQADQALRERLAEVATEEAKNAAERATAARQVRAATLEAEQKRKAEEAARKAEEAKNASPARSAVLTLESLVSAFESAESGELSRAARVRTMVENARRGLDRVVTRNEVIQRLFPEGAELDGWKAQALDDEVRRLDAAQRVLKTSLRAPAIALASESREWFRRRDRLEEFVNLIDQIRNPIVDDERAQGFQLRGVDDQQDRYLEAVRIFDDPATSFRDLFRGDFEAAEARLREIADKRIEDLETLDGEASKLFGIHDDLESALGWRRRYLASVSLWIKSPAPFSSTERAAAFDEVTMVGAAFTDSPDAISETWERWSAMSVGALWLPALLAAWIAVSLLGGPILGRRMLNAPPVRKPRDELDPLSVALKVALSVAARTLPSLLLLCGTSWLAWVLLPSDPVASVAFSILIAYWLWRATGVLADVVLGRAGTPGLVRCDEKTALRARRVTLLLARGVALLFPAGHALHALGFHRLAVWSHVILGSWSVLVSAWLVVRREALLLVVPKDGGLLARTFRALLPYVWPIAVAFYGGVVVLAIRGYRNAAWHYGSRFLLCAAVLVAGAIVFQIVAALLARRLGPRNEQEQKALENPSAERATPRLVAFRILRSLAFVAVAGASILTFSGIFALEQADWDEVANTALLNLTDSDPLRIGDLARAILVLISGLALARWTRDSIRVAMASRMQRGSRYVVRTLVYYSLVAITVVMAFGALGLNLNQLGWFLAAAGVGIGFGLQEVISNFIAGLILFFERPVQVGDIISVGQVEGDVTRINIRSTEVRTRDGISIIIPNKRFITDDVINWSHGDQRTRLRTSVGVAYGSDIDLVRKILMDVGTQDPRVLKFPQPEVNFREFGESELSFELMVWLKSPDPTLRRHVTTEINSAIDATFREHGVQIPFPQRDLHLRSNDTSSGA